MTCSRIRNLRSGCSPAKTGASYTKNAISERRYIRKDGEIVWVKNRVSVLRDSHGNPVNSVAVTEEIPAKRPAGSGAANCKFRLLAMDLFRSDECERRRIARELHDSTAQLL